MLVNGYLRPFEVINDSLHPNSRRVIMRVLCFLRLSDLQGQSLKPSVQIQRYSQINKILKNKNWPQMTLKEQLVNLVVQQENWKLMSLFARSAVTEWSEFKLFGFVLFILFLARFEKDSPWVLEPFPRKLLFRFQNLQTP